VLDMALPKLWPVLLLLALPAICAAHNQTFRAHDDPESDLRHRELRFWPHPVHSSEFTLLQRSTNGPSCEATQPPQALTTPDPVIDEASTTTTVSFIIGTDGRVHSPLILESDDPAQDRTILDAVRSWRYRPGTCNGVPTESEAKIGFFSR